MTRHPFHLAIPVHDLGEARAFYVGVLGCREGRSSERWVDFDFFGHQLVAHLGLEALDPARTDEVDGDAVPVRHFGVVLPWEEFPAVERRLREAAVPFLIEPRTRFAGRPGEQASMLCLDPSGNALEFKALRDPALLFGR